MPVVLVIVFAIVAVQLVALFVLVPAVRRARLHHAAVINAELARLAETGEKLVLGPQRMYVRKGPLSSPRTVYLTDKRLVLVGSKPGARTEIERSTIASARTDKWFFTKRTGGRTFVILKVPDGEFALHMPDAMVHEWAAPLGAG
jgi:hypothetical protein